jgi:hypothetical protein
MWPMLDSTMKPWGRKLAIVFALVGDSTITSDLPTKHLSRWRQFSEKLRYLKVTAIEIKAVPASSVARKRGNLYKILGRFFFIASGAPAVKNT